MEMDFLWQLILDMYPRNFSEEGKSFILFFFDKSEEGEYKWGGSY